MPIFGADYTEPEGSQFKRTADDFGLLRKALKEVETEFKKNFKFFKSMKKPLDDVCLAVNHFYDCPHTTTEYRTRGSRLTNMVSRISVGIETYEQDYGTLMESVGSYAEKLKNTKTHIEDRNEKLADYNAKKKSFTSSQSKEGKDPAKLTAIREKYQAAKDAFETADAKVIKEMNDIQEEACREFEECYVKFLKTQSALFAAAAVALGDQSVLSTISSQTNNIDDNTEMSPRQYKDQFKDMERKIDADKKEKKNEKREKRKTKKSSYRQSTTPTTSNHDPLFDDVPKRPDDQHGVFEPPVLPTREHSLSSKTDDLVPPPSLSTPPIERSYNASKYSPAPAVNNYDAYNDKQADLSGPPIDPPPRPLATGKPVTDLDLIGRDMPDSPKKVKSARKSTQPTSPAPALPPGRTIAKPTDAPPTLPPGRPDPYSTNESAPPPLPAGRQTNTNPSYQVLEPTIVSIPPPQKPEASGPPPLPPGRASNDTVPDSTLSNPPTLPPGRSASVSSQSTNDPPPLPSGRTISVSSQPGNGPPPALPAGRTAPISSQPTNDPPLPSGRTASSQSTNGPPPPLPSGRTASVSSQPTNGPPPLPSGRTASVSTSTTSSTMPPALPPGRVSSMSVSTSSSLGSIPTPAPPKVTSSTSNKASSPSIPIPTDEIHKYGLIFKREDPSQVGFITGQHAFQLFMRSKLPAMELAQIWELSDQDKDGQLTKDEFIIAMWYINSRLKGTIETVPSKLPPALVLANYPDRKLPSF